MRERALVHVAGPPDAGKTTFIERLLDAEVAFAICARAEREVKLRKGQESAPKAHAIERAQLVIVNVRSDTDHLAAESVVVEVARLRKDEDVYRDVVGVRGNKLPVTAVVADLANPKDPGLKKAVALVKRATERRKPWAARRASTHEGRSQDG